MSDKKVEPSALGGATKKTKIYKKTGKSARAYRRAQKLAFELDAQGISHDVIAIELKTRMGYVSFKGQQKPLSAAAVKLMLKQFREGKRDPGNLEIGKVVTTSKGLTQIQSSSLAMLKVIMESPLPEDQKLTIIRTIVSKA
jgi:hypothetical protein